MRIPNIAVTIVIAACLFFELDAQTPSSSAGKLGAIEGKVVDSKGGPIAGARVYAAPLGGAETRPNGKLVYAVSDENGQFLLQSVGAGTNILMSGKQEEGYCDTLYAPFTENIGALPKIVVKDGETSRGIVLVLSSCGILEAEVSEQLTGAPIPSAQIHLIREDNPDLDLRTSPDRNGKFKFVLPKIPYTIEVSAPGFKMWRKTGIVLGPNENFKLKIELVPMNVGGISPK